MNTMARNTNINVRKRPRGSISIDSTILLTSFLNACLDQTVVERALQLALRGPEYIRDGVKTFLENQGLNVNALVHDQPDTPTSQSEVREFVEPFLKKGAEISTLAQMTDIYLFAKDATAENVVYAFYIGTRYALVRERKPTKEESKRIWEIALWIAKNSKIGAIHWKQLELRGQVHLNDWLNVMKENARKRFETFLRQKERARRASDASLEALLSAVFDVQ